MINRLKQRISLMLIRIGIKGLDCDYRMFLDIEDELWMLRREITDEKGRRKKQPDRLEYLSQALEPRNDDGKRIVLSDFKDKLP